MSPRRNLRLFLLLLFVAGLGYGLYSFWLTSKNPLPTTNSTANLYVILQEDYQPKMRGYFPQPITVENTEVYLGFPGPNKPATPKEHLAIVQFLNGLCQSTKNTRIERNPFLEASDPYVKVVSKDSTRTVINFEVFHNGIKTSDGEVIIPEARLIKLINH